MLADDIARSLLAVRRQVAVDKVVADQTLEAGDLSVLELRQKEARESILVVLVGSQTGGGADRCCNQIRHEGVHPSNFGARR